MVRWGWAVWDLGGLVLCTEWVLVPLGAPCLAPKACAESGFGFGVFGERARGSWGLGEWEICPVLGPKCGLQLLSEGWGISWGWGC